MKKIISIGIMAGLTTGAASACRWQYKRYNESIEKWKRIDDQFDSNFIPPFKSIGDILQLSTDNHQYLIYDTKGILDNHFYQIWRYKDGRPGIILCGILKDQDDNVIIDLGWIPQTHMNYHNDLAGKQLEMRVMVRKPEFIDTTTQGQDIKTFIDLESICNDLNLPQNTKKIYLERIALEDQEGGLFKSDSMQLYPVPTFKSTINKPYLTPDKHQAYCMFWGSCTLFGIYSIQKILRW